MKDIMIQKTMENLRRHRIHATCVPSTEELLREIQSLLFRDAVIGAGDSVTMEQTGIFQFLKSGDYKYLDKHEHNLTGDEKREIYRKNFHADFFFSGVNAVTESGHLYFIDGNGSRIAPIIYGPDKVILIAGTNKITADDEEAKKRVRRIAAPLDAKRLGKKTPCAATGTCVDCKSPERICNDFLCITGQFTDGRIHVFLVDGEYGY